jgi:TetR/AcrR family transcriptional regulator, mexJK operon transcriptional repressor
MSASRAAEEQLTAAERGQPAKRQAIVRAARRVFLAHGYTDAGVDAIAAEAGVSKQTVYNHFGDKERLFRSVMHDTLEAVGHGLGPAPSPDALAESTDLERDLRTLGRALARSVLQEDVAALRRVLMAELDRHPELMDVWGAKGRELQRSLARAIQRQAQRGALDVADPDLAAEQLVQLTAGTTLTRTRFGVRRLSDAELARAVDDGIDLWLRAYRATRAPRSGDAR